MHFDDRLATVLRLSPSGDALARIQFRQLVDILGRAPANAGEDALAAALGRLDDLSKLLPASERARLLRQPLQPITNARLIATLADAEPDVASAAIGAARLDDDEWQDLIPRLPVRARGILRHRRDLSPPVEALLERLGVHDRALPAADSPVEVAAAEFRSDEPNPEDPLPDTPTRFRAPTGNMAVDQDMSQDVIDLLDMGDNAPPPTSLSEWARARASQHQRNVEEKASLATPSEAGIGAIVRRIEAFRKARAAQPSREHDTDAPRLPLGDILPAVHRLAQAIDFMTDAQGCIVWADGPHAPSVVGFNLSGVDKRDGSRDFLAAAVRQRMPIRAGHIFLDGAPSISGTWQIDAAPRFEASRFTGYVGRLRRPAAPPTASGTRRSRPPEADRMREVLHELRTPANAIQVAAEIIQQQLYGPAPHEYRALAAAIAGDCAHILAGFEELDRLVKLESGAMPLEQGECDLARVLAQTVLRLRAWTEPRGSGFALPADPSSASLPILLARSETERLVWRFLAALAGSTAPGEMLHLDWTRARNRVELVVGLPAMLAEREPDTLFSTNPIDRAQSLAAGMFGIGFTLRLAMAEAAAAGGALQRVENTFVLSLPALTEAGAPNSSSAA